jgi:sporulation protein YlmC with PRC-barrel domain
MTVLLASSSLSGDKVVNSAGEELGDIKDLMIDCNDGRVAYAVLEFGGFLGIGSKLFAVPMRALSVDTANKRLILNVAKERLKDAPGFDKDHWPDFADATFAAQIHDYYGVPRRPM